MCQVLFATHLIYIIWGDIIHISEIIKLRLKEAKYFAPDHKASTTVRLKPFPQFLRFFLGPHFHLVYKNKNTWSVFHSKMWIICFPEPNTLG